MIPLMFNKLILGTVQFGLDYGINNATGKPSKEKVFELLEYAYLNGIKVLDTADAYGNASEILGDFHNSHPFNFEINTKFKGNQDTISHQLSKSLKLLNLNYINTYFFHSFSDLLNYPGLTFDLISLKEESLIRKIGISVYDNNEFETAINTPEIDVIQFPFNLLDNQSQRGELIKLAKSKGKELQVRSIFIQGLFFKPIETIPEKLSSLKPYLENLHCIAKDNSLLIEELALLYALQQKEIENIIIGVDNLSQLKRNIDITKRFLEPGIVEEIDKIMVKETDLLYPKNWN